MDNATISLALSDFLPSLLYLAGGYFLVRILRAINERELAGMFMAGTAFAAFAGFAKAASKVADAVAVRPVTESGFLYDQMFPTMAVGFLATGVAIIFGARRFSGRDTAGARTRFAEAASWLSPLAAGAFLGLAYALVMAANVHAELRPHFLDIKRISMLAMIFLQFATMGILAWFCFKEGSRLGGSLAILSIVSMLLMGALGSGSMQARFQDRILMNWIDQSVNIVAQGAYLCASIALWYRARAGKMAAAGARRITA